MNHAEAIKLRRAADLDLERQRMSWVRSHLISCNDERERKSLLRTQGQIHDKLAKADEAYHRALLSEEQVVEEVRHK